MMVNGVNLVPMARRYARRRRVWIRFWMTVCVLYMALWLVAFLTAQLTLVSDDRELRMKFDEVYAEVEEAKKEAATLRARISGETSRLQASRAVGEQPDWSLLLALLSETLGDRAVLRSVRLEDGNTVGDAAGESGDAAARPVTLALSGLGQTQQVVSQLVLRLEQTPLFKSVRLIDTRREPFLAGHAVAFRIECVLEAPKET